MYLRDRRKRVLYDRDQNCEGFGIVRVDYGGAAFVLECWPWSADPSADDAAQYPGWPYRVPFEETDDRRG